MEEGVTRNIIFLCFSKDRPLQLDLCLRTARKQCQDWEKLKKTIIYKASTPRYSKAYLRLKKDYPEVEFIKEGDFKTDLLCAIENYRYIFFCVDDTVFTKKFNAEEATIVLASPHLEALGFSLRLGKNTEWCFPHNSYNYIPAFFNITDDILKANWTLTGFGDFSYPLELSSSIYKKEIIFPALEKTEYENPNELEWKMYVNLFYFTDHNNIVFYKTSVAFSNPINKVQEFNPNANRAGENVGYSPEKLLEIFEEWKRIDDVPFDGFVSNGCHQLIDITFI